MNTSETPIERAKRLQGVVHVRVDGKDFVEGVDFALNRVRGTFTLLRDSALGAKGTNLAFSAPIDYTATRPPAMRPPKLKKPRKTAQWKTRRYP